MSRQDYAEYVAAWTDPARVSLGPYFGYFSVNMPFYPPTLNLHARYHLQPPGTRPILELEPTDHPFSRDSRDGMTTETVAKFIELILHPKG